MVLEELGHGFLQSSVALIRVFLKVYGFGAVSAPDQLLFCRIIQVYEQRSDGNSGCLAGYCTAIESAPTASPSPRSAVTKCRQVDAFFLPDNGVIADVEIRILAARARKVGPLVSFVGTKVRTAVVVVVNILCIERSHANDEHG
jgi:hypothetical protein